MLAYNLNLCMHLLELYQCNVSYNKYIQNDTIHIYSRKEKSYMCHHPIHAHPGIHGPRREKTCLRVFANNTGAVQPAHLRSLISAFVIRFLESTICKLTTGEISIF